MLLCWGRGSGLVHGKRKRGEAGLAGVFLFGYLIGQYTRPYSRS
jgi:hypothetical protein